MWPVWLLGIAAALFVLYLELVFVAPIALAIGALVALVVVGVECAAAAASAFRPGAPIDHLGIAPAPRSDAPGTPDPAYRSYYFGPILRDFGVAVQAGARRGWEKTFTGSGPGNPSVTMRIVDTWTNIGGGDDLAKVFTFLPMAGAVVGVAVGAAVAAVFVGVTAVVFAMLISLVVVVTLVLTGLLRVVEVATLRLRGITLECAGCHQRIVAPVYECTHCPDGDRARHHRLVPGSMGVFSRTCRCGGVLPTLLARGKWKLPGFCHHDGCGYPLPVKGLTTPTFHIPVVAGTTAGKTVFMMAAIADLESRARLRAEDDPGHKPEFEFADDNSKSEYRRVYDSLKDAQFGAIAATRPHLPLRASTIYLGAEGSRARRLLYLYDAAGERYKTADGLLTFRFLGFTAGVVLIVDPFAFEPVRRAYEPELLAGLRFSPDNPADVIGRFAAGLRENRGLRADRRIDVPVAVVLTKCDALLASGKVAHPYEQLDPGDGDAARATRSAAVRDWLADTAGARGAVTSLESTFGRCGYFAVSALDAFGLRPEPSGRTTTLTRNDAPSAPLSWLLTRPAGRS